MSNVSLRGRLSRHLAVAATVAAGAAGAASAQIVYWGDANLVVPATIDGLYINVETQQTGSSGGSVAGWDINPYSATGLTFFNASGSGIFRLPGATTPSSVAIGTVIDSSGTFAGGSASTSSAVGAWTLNASNYFGFRFVASDGGTKYAWARFVIGPALNDGSRMIAEIAYESSGGAITVGAIPAPGAVALLGLAGLAGSRRRRG
jgi:MYXO-CTERM domain-containing protein